MKTNSQNKGKELFIIIFLITLFFPKVLVASDNPHIDFYSCIKCHSQIPDTQDVLSNQFFLIELDIEKKCYECHTTHNTINDHPVGIKPKQNVSLPLQKGYIKCITCHYCNSVDGEFNTSMLRLAESLDTLDSFEERKADMCRICHVNY